MQARARRARHKAATGTQAQDRQNQRSAREPSGRWTQLVPHTKKSEELALQAKKILDQADIEGRSLTPREAGEVEELLARSREERSIEEQIKNADGTGPRVTLAGDGSSQFGSPGERFVQSAGYKAIADPAARSTQWSSGPVKVGLLSAKGTLTSTGAGGPGGGLVQPHIESGIVQTLFEPGVADLFSTSQISAGQVRYVVEGTATSGAAGVLETGLKPESTLGLSEALEPVKKVATTLPISDELLEDAPSVQTYLNERLSLFVSNEVSRQLLRGTAGNEIEGLFERGISTYAAGTVDSNSVALLKAAAGVRGSANLEPDAVILHPADWLHTRLEADDNGQFLGGGPFTGAYGQGGPSATSQFSAAPLWGMRVVTSTVVGSGTALLGSFRQGAHIWRRGGVTVEATSSHGELFVHDISVLRAESRLALGLFRPASFVQVTGLSA
jgi:HK97 family phage major capsid protein